MTDERDEELGPIEWALVEVAGTSDQFDEAMAAELLSLVDTELIRIIDLVIIAKGVTGLIDVTEFEDLSEVHALRALEGQLAEVLGLEDIETASALMNPGSTACLFMWENTWAAPFGVAARRSGGQLMATGQIPAEALIAAIPASSSAIPTAMRPSRSARRGVIHEPVVKSGAAVATAAVVEQGVDSRADRTEHRREH